MSGPRSLPPGEAAGWRLLTLLLFVASMFGLSVGAIIYCLFSWLESYRSRITGN